jgi:hypothetical protein
MSFSLQPDESTGVTELVYGLKATYKLDRLRVFALKPHI